MENSLQTFEFETVSLDERGQVVERRKGQTLFFHYINQYIIAQLALFRNGLKDYSTRVLMPRRRQMTVDFPVVIPVTTATCI